MPLLDITDGVNVEVSFSSAPNFDITINRGPLSGGNPGGPNLSLQYNANGIFGGIPTANYSGGNLNLGLIDNLKITGGLDGQFLRTDGNGNLSFVSGGGGNGSPGGSNTQVQFNDGGIFGGDVDFTYNKTTNTLICPNVLGQLASFDEGDFTNIEVDGVANLGQTSNLKLFGGSSGQVLTATGDANGNVYWNTPSSGVTHLYQLTDVFLPQEANFTVTQITTGGWGYTSVVGQTLRLTGPSLGTLPLAVNDIIRPDNNVSAQLYTVTGYDWNPGNPVKTITVSGVNPAGQNWGNATTLNLYKFTPNANIADGSVLSWDSANYRWTNRVISDLTVNTTTTSTATANLLVIPKVYGQAIQMTVKGLDTNSSDYTLQTVTALVPYDDTIVDTFFAQLESNTVIYNSLNLNLVNSNNNIALQVTPATSNTINWTVSYKTI